jgi:hypothetical protein
MIRHSIAAVALFVLLSPTVPIWAHHSFTAEFDGSKLVGVKGVLTRVEWENPHVWFYVDVKDEHGAVSNWAFETVSPNHIHHQYPEAREDFISNIGKIVTVTACPAKNVPHRGSAESIMLENGKIMKVGLGGNYTGSASEDDVLRSVR